MTDPAPFPCPTCTGQTRETTGMVCQTCGTDYGAAPPEDHAQAAQRAAEEHLERCMASLDEDLDEEPDTLAPYCGCLTCLVREALHAAYPQLRAMALADAADELERRMQAFPLQGRHTRAAWAVAALRGIAREKTR